jgi:C-terminal processing protease CtpA/Prc
MWKISYYYNLVSPRQGLNITVKSSNEKNPRELNIASKITPLPSYVDFNNLIRDITLSDGKVIENRFIKVGKTAIWQMPTFAIDPSVVEGFMKGDIIQNSSNLIIDLRGNGGGYVVTLEALAGYFVNEDKKIADLKGRKEMKPQMAKTRKSNVYKGNLIILIDSRSASASEIFARFMQLEQRGVVIGDVSAGAVMQSIGVPLQMGDAKVILYGMSLTNADVIMSDGKSLEHSGVTPQLYLIPTPQEISLGQDKVLATALKLFDENVSPEEAGKFFPYKWEDK